MQTAISVLIAVIAAFIGYLFSQRTKNNERFISQVSDSLNEIFEPMYLEIMNIKRIKEPKDREDNLKVFFGRYKNGSIKLHKIANGYILNWFLKMNKDFEEYQNLRNEESWNEFWCNFELFSTMIEDEYCDNFNVLYRQYKWMRKISNGNYLYRFILEFVRIFYETVKFLVILSFLILGLYFYFIFIDKVFGFYPKWLPAPKKEIFQFILIIELLLLMLFGVCMGIASSYLALTDKYKIKRNNLKLFSMSIPSVSKQFDKIIEKDIKRMKKRIKVPKMYG